MDDVGTLVPGEGTDLGGAAAADLALLTGEDTAPETPVVVEETTLPETTDSGPARDPKGRFASPPTPEPPSDPEAVPEAEPAAELTDIPETQPYKYNADGAEHEVDGAVIDGEWLKIPAAKVPEINALLSEGHAWRGSAQRWFSDANTRQQQTERRALDAETRVQAAEKQSQAILSHFEQLIEASLNVPPDQIFNTPLGQWLLDVRGNWGVLKADSRAAALQMQLDARQKQAEESSKAQEDATLKPKMETAIGHWVAHHGNAAGLERSVLERLYADLKDPKYEKLLFVRAEQDDPLSGIRKGELVIDHGFIAKEVQRISQWVKPGTPAGKPVPAVVKPVVKPPVGKPNKVPPTVSATKGPSPKKSTWTPKSQQEADDALRFGGQDDDE